MVLQKLADDLTRIWASHGEKRGKTEAVQKKSVALCRCEKGDQMVYEIVRGYRVFVHLIYYWYSTCSHNL